ncbi:hypothetical protein ANCCAN_06385 [Ancylostoma caninum]|uniref:Uncharacterized protein n=1 Tax=Ancylostoma caninum TaxID=29170 RepID=A0A368GV54_ANCCA|nr:hypothetical protein ANCCAN_06385 [Ancylostoma caninum]
MHFILELNVQDISTDPTVEEYIERIVREENPDLSALSDEQLNELIRRLFILKNNLADGEDDIIDQGEAEEAIPLDALADEKLVLKKDAEELGDVRQGEAEEAIPLDALADEKLVLKKDAEELGDVRQASINSV